MALLHIRDLHIEFGAGRDAVRVVDGVSLALEPGKALCLVGESGSGKSVTALSIARLLPSPPARFTGGSVLVDDREVLQMPAAELRRLRGGVVSYVFQEAGASLNPVLRVGAQILESLRTHRPARATEAEVIRLLKGVGIPAAESRMRCFPHELSGGLQQRVLIAMALASEPRLLVADEPTTALDVTVQAQIIELLNDLRRRLGMAILLITHNLGLVGDLADDVAVLYAGQIVEQGPARDVLRRPLHPYTRALLDSVPAMGAGAERLAAIPGQVPVPGSFPPGCRFHPRCPVARPECARNAPVLAQATPARSVRCPFWAEPESGRGSIPGA